ncbi:MAG: ATP-binding protein, partial [Deltaproteobacteria bacterium]|nr:ATP-binding protein [Deltaproteobacteria bacterium]
MILRDFLDTLRASIQLESVMLLGPRQVGKSTLLEQLEPASHLIFDDFGLRERAQKDPALVLDGTKLPCLLDEAQYAPNLFPEVKLRIDNYRRARRRSEQLVKPPLFYITGSNRTLLDKNVGESLSGRSHLYYLLGLSVREIRRAFPSLGLKTILIRGGLPELYVREELKFQNYLNDYLITFVERDLAVSGGIEKLSAFNTVLRLLAARTAQFLNASEVSAAAGIDQKTVQSWIGILERNLIIQLLPTYSSNLSKRIIKMRKLFFCDTGLCARLQGHLDEEPLWNSPHAGALFETLVFSEIQKCIFNFLKPWHLFTWRTKEKNEIDFVLVREKDIVFIESKLGIHGARHFDLDVEAKKIFPPPHHKVVVTAGGISQKLSKDTLA